MLYQPSTVVTRPRFSASIWIRHHTDTIFWRTKLSKYYRLQRLLLLFGNDLLLLLSGLNIYLHTALRRSLFDFSSIYLISPRHPSSVLKFGTSCQFLRGTICLQYYRNDQLSVNYYYQVYISTCTRRLRPISLANFG